MLTITKQLERRLGIEFKGDQLSSYGEFLYGFTRWTKPYHVLMQFDAEENNILVFFVGQALKDNAAGGVSMVGINLKELIAKTGLSMQAISVPADHEVPLQHDLDLLITDNMAGRERYYDRIRMGGNAITLDDCQSGGVDTFKLPHGKRLWRV